MFWRNIFKIRSIWKLHEQETEPGIKRNKRDGSKLQPKNSIWRLQWSYFMIRTWFILNYGYQVYIATERDLQQKCFTDTVTFIFSKRSINGPLVIRKHGIDIEWHQIDRNLSKFKTIITKFPQIFSIFPDNVTKNLHMFADLFYEPLFRFISHFLCF